MAVCYVSQRESKLLPEPVQSNAKQCCPLTKAFCVILSSPVNVKIPSRSDKTATTAS